MASKVFKFCLLKFLFLLPFSLCSQSVSCEDLMEYVKKEGYRKGSVTSILLIDSSWLNEVEAWKVDDVMAVIAEIKKDQWGISTQKYIFCGIPSSNWSAFQYGTYDYGSTYGERFHKYIMDYKCNCY